jgi:hypothetical protein
MQHVATHLVVYGVRTSTDSSVYRDGLEVTIADHIDTCGLGVRLLGGNSGCGVEAAFFFFFLHNSV